MPSSDFESTAFALEYQGTSFSYIWLRDSCQCLSCIHPTNKQKLHRSSDIDVGVTPAPEGVKVTDQGVEVTWNSGHKSIYPAQFLDRHSSAAKLSQSHNDVPPILWDQDSITKARNLSLPYESIQSSSGLLLGITQLLQYGVVFITGVPNLETSYENCGVRKLAERFGGQVRNNMYGEIWDILDGSDSLTSMHQDLPYFENPPKYLALHSVRNRVVGGNCLFIDALNAANILRRSNPDAFNVLATTPVSFHLEHNGHHLHRSHTIIEMYATSGTSLATQSIKCINYSPAFQAPLALTTPPSFYTALKEFAALLNKPELTYEHQLKEGDGLLFENRRLLHGRTVFEDKSGMTESEINRWQQGCWFEADTLWESARVLRAKAEACEFD